MTTHTQGGKRPGAGRPPLPESEQPEAITIRAHKKAVRQFKDHCKARGESHREAFERISKRLKS